MRAVKVRFRQFRLRVPGEVALGLLAKLAVVLLFLLRHC
jgi:hypothetical protein